MTRRQIRENVFKMLFRIEFHETEELSEQLNMFEYELDQAMIPEGDEDSEGTKAGEEDIRYIKEKCADIMYHVKELDEQINASAVGWKTGRMSKMDLTILRLAVYEMKYEDAIPVRVAINEAVELAKKYGTADSSSFVNGVLAKMAK